MSDLKYRVTSRQIVDLIAGLRSGRLTKSPFFQRDLVWRETHRREFIETILIGLPFPQIFLARGKIDVESMEAYTCVVDGQQRLNAIEEYVDGNIAVGGKTFKELLPEEKEAFIKYEVPVIDFDLSESDPRLKDVFKRLNRTYYSLSSVEKVASEFSGSEFLIAARVVLGDFLPQKTDEAGGEAILEDEENPFLLDPALQGDALNWAKNFEGNSFKQLLDGDRIFSSYESARKVPLMFVLTIMSTVVFGSYFKRTDKVQDYLELHNEVFDQKIEVISKIDSVAAFINKLSLVDGSFWLRKANFFTLCVELSKVDLEALDVAHVIDRLEKFAEVAPESYLAAQREAVNGRQERILRGEQFRRFVLEDDNTVLDDGV